MLPATRRLLSLTFGAVVVLGHDNGLAITPQMGWNTWEHFGCSYDADLILSAAKSMIAYGLPQLGYNYVLMDDCWQAPARDPTTNKPVADPNMFPNGIKNLTDEIHNLGLKFGIYSDAGMYTCGGRFGSLDFEEIDAQTYAEWGVDYLKYDNCYNEGRSGTPKISFDRYANMSRALNATGRPILYSMCNWGEDGPWNFAPTIANSWRISGDVMDNFDRWDVRCPCESVLDCKLAGFCCSVSRIIDFVAPVLQKSGPNHWNDMDMMPIGNGGMTYDQYVTMFSMWSIAKSPLILGNDVTNMANSTLEIITNDEIIGINQDAAGSPATRRWRKTIQRGGSLQLWQGSLVNDVFVIAVCNTSPTNQTLDVLFSDAFVDQGAGYQAGTFAIYDLWQKDANGNWGESLGDLTTSIPDVTVGPYQTKVWKAVHVSSPSTARRSIDEL